MSYRRGSPFQFQFQVPSSWMPNIHFIWQAIARFGFYSFMPAFVLGFANAIGDLSPAGGHPYSFLMVCAGVLVPIPHIAT